MVCSSTIFQKGHMRKRASCSDPVDLWSLWSLLFGRFLATLLGVVLVSRQKPCWLRRCRTAGALRGPLMLRRGRSGKVTPRLEALAGGLRSIHIHSVHVWIGTPPSLQREHTSSVRGVNCSVSRHLVVVPCRHVVPLFLCLVGNFHLHELVGKVMGPRPPRNRCLP